MNLINNLDQLISVGRLQENSIVNADCLEAMKFIADGSIDAIICDPPYG